MVSAACGCVRVALNVGGLALLVALLMLASYYADPLDGQCARQHRSSR